MLVAVQDLMNYMTGSNFSASQQTKATGVLNAAQKELEDYLNRPVELVQVREFSRSDFDGIINVSVTPIVKVIQYGIAEAGQTMSVPDATQAFFPPPMARDTSLPTDGRLIDLAGPSYGTPFIEDGGINVGTWNTMMFVEYIGGYDGSNDQAMKEAIMRVAAREMERDTDDTLDLRASSAEMANESDTRQKGWTNEELQQFDRVRRRVVA